MTSEPQAEGHSAISDARHGAFQRIWLMPGTALVMLGVAIAMGIAGASPTEPDVSDLLHWGANYAPRTLRGEWWRLLTAAFIHAGIPHLAINLLCLIQAGYVVEKLYGRGGFLVLTLASAVLGSLASCWWNPEALSVGASGIVFGLFAGVLVCGPGFNDLVSKPELRRVQATALFLLAFNLTAGLMQEGVDLACHLGGLAAGLGFGLLLQWPDEPGQARGHLLRTSQALMLLAFLAGAFAYVLPTPADDFYAALDRIGREDLILRTDLAEAMRDWRAHHLSNAQMQQAVEEAQTRWEATVRDVESIRVGNEQSSAMAVLLDYVQQRSIALGVLQDVAREGKPGLLLFYREASRSADELAGALWSRRTPLPK